MRPKRRMNRGLSTLLRWGVVLTALTLLVAGRGMIWELSLQAALLSGKLMLPLSGESTSEIDTTDMESEDEPESSVSSQEVSSVVTSSVSETLSSLPASSAVVSQAAKKYLISEQFFMPGTSDMNVSGVTLTNKTKEHTVNIAAELAKQPAIKIYKNSRPQVLIIHTHATESYMEEEAESYEKNMDKRSTDEDQNMIRIGEELVKALNAAGIKAIHDKTLYDYPNYTGCYDRAAAGIQATLKKYSSIDVVIDLHRDCIEKSDGTRIKPTALINNKKAAQIMIISGCNEEGALSFPTWEYNLRFAVRIQKDMNKNYPGLARPIFFTNRRYNMHLTKGSLLIEVGSDVNTLDEAIYSGQMLGQSLTRVLEDLS